VNSEHEIQAPGTRALVCDTPVGKERRRGFRWVAEHEDRRTPGWPGQSREPYSLREVDPSLARTREPATYVAHTDGGGPGGVRVHLAKVFEEPGWQESIVAGRRSCVSK
jgi:hypothetical protein